MIPENLKTVLNKEIFITSVDKYTEISDQFHDYIKQNPKDHLLEI